MSWEVERHSLSFPRISIVGGKCRPKNAIVRTPIGSNPPDIQLGYRFLKGDGVMDHPESVGSLETCTGRIEEGG